MLKKALLMVFILVLSAGLVLTGCSNTTETTAPTTGPTTTPAATGEPQYGGTLRIISGAEINSFMVGEMFSPEDMQQRIPSIQTLVRYNPTTQTVVPYLAKEIIQDPANLTVTFKLRDNVKFHDGTICDAEAIKWNLDQEAIAPNTGPDFIDVSSIDIADANTIVVKFSKWDSSFLREMCWDSAIISPTAFETKGLDYVRTNPIGTGPFKLVSFTRDVSKIFEKFDDYWEEGKPYLDKIQFNIIADATVQMASLLKGENDILSGINFTDVKTVLSKDGFGISRTEPVSGYYYAMAGDSANPDSPFANLKVRQAVSYAIDREAIKSYVFYDYAEVTNGMNSPQCVTYNPNVKGYDYNVTKAKELLAEAGYTDGITATMYCRSEKYYKDMAVAIQSNLADVGIVVDLQVLNAGQYGEMNFGTGWENGLFLANMVGDTELGVVGRFFLSKDAGIGFTNSIIHPNDVETALSNMMSATTEEAKIAYAWEWHSLVVDTYCMLTPIMAASTITAYADTVHDPYMSQSWTYGDAWIAQ